MKPWRRAFLQGYARAPIRTSRQRLARALLDGMLLAFLFFGPWRWWWRLLLCILARFVYGLFASSRRFYREL